MKWKEWQNAGKDVHSLYTNPQFTNAGLYDFSLQKTSPAFQLGFQPINMEIIGPRKK
jgi:hypothetical protein